jgi:hypothetical protein
MSAILFMKRMKKLFQIVALAIGTLLAAQPALAGLPCAVGTRSAAGCAPDCGVAMSQTPPARIASSSMAADCPMSPQISSDGCAQNCCGNHLSQEVAKPASGAKSDIGRSQHFVSIAESLAFATPAFVLIPYTILDSTPPARYILFQVFRI